MQCQKFLLLSLLSLSTTLLPVTSELTLLVSVSGHDYFVDMDAELTWAEAKNYCRINALFLGQVETQRKSAIVISALAPLVGRNGTVWTSGSDEDAEGLWYWDTTGEFFTYTFWHFNTDPPQSDSMVNCVAIAGSNVGVYWVAKECQEKFPVLCQT